MGALIGRRLGHDDHQVGVLAIRNERLLAIQHVFVAVPHRRRAHAGEVGAGARLAHRDRRDHLA
jgi:hypothetical protein